MKTWLRSSAKPAGTWWLYVLECRGGVLYTGIAKDVEARFEAHLKGTGAIFTRLNRPVRILGRAIMATQGEALRAEYAFKQVSRADKLQWCATGLERFVMAGPLLTLKVHATLRAAARAGATTVECSLDLERSRTTVEVGDAGWRWRGRRFPYLETCKDRTVYHWTGESFQPVARFTTSLIKLVPTQWGAPTFEIDGIKMLPTAHVSPYADAERKVGLIRPRGKVILDTCGGLGYFAAWCLRGQAKQVQSYEKNADVIWLRSLNPWSPETGGGLTLTHGDIVEQIGMLPGASVDAILHDPPRFGIAGELYSQAFYDQLARVLKRGGKLFHYTGAPNKLTSGRDVPEEVAKRLRRAGFSAQSSGDGVLAVKK